MKKRILVISQCFFPEQFRINDISEQWVKRGYDVTVVTAIPNYPQGKFYDGYVLNKKRTENYKGMKIIRLPIIPRGNNVIMLFLNYLSFVISGFFWSKFTKLDVDYVFNFETSPITQSLLGVWYSKRKKKPFYLYIQDLWPENVESVAGIKNKFILNLIGKMVDYIYSNSTKIFATSNSMVKVIESRNVDESKLKYWPQYAEEFYKPVDKEDVDIEIKNKIPPIGKNGKPNFNLIFTGNIGYAQGLDILPKVACILKKEDLSKNIVFNIIGDGRFKSNLIDIVKKSDVESMFNFIERQPAQMIPQYMALSDVAVLTLQDNKVFSMTIPAKLQSYIACAMPIIASAQGETKNIIEEANCGICVDTGDEVAFSDAVKQMILFDKEKLRTLGNNGYEYSKKNFDRDLLLDEIDLYFNE